MTTSKISHAGSPASVRSRGAAGISIFLGAVLFWAFWFSGLLWQEGGVIIGVGEVAWFVQLAIHAMMALLLGTGLVTVARSTTKRRGVCMAGAILLPLGMLINPLVMWIGIVLLAAHTWSLNHRVAAGLLLSGAGGLVTAFALGVRVGTEGMPALSIAQEAWYGAGLTFTTLGLIVIGSQTLSTGTKTE